MVIPQVRRRMFWRNVRSFHIFPRRWGGIQKDFFDQLHSAITKHAIKPGVDLSCSDNVGNALYVRHDLVNDFIRWASLFFERLVAIVLSLNVHACWSWHFWLSRILRRGI